MKTKLSQGLIAGAVAVVFAGSGLAIAQSTGGDATSGPSQDTQQQSQQMGNSTALPGAGSSMSNNQGSVNTSPAATPDLNSAPVERSAQADRN